MPFNTEIQLDPLPEYPTDNSSDPQDWFIHLETKGDFPSREDEWKVKALLKYLPDQYHAELLPLLSEPGRRYEKMRDHLIIQHPTYEGYPLGYYKRKLDDLKAMWVNPAQMRGYLLKLRNLQKKMCEKLNMPNAIWDEETLRAAYLEALPARMTHLVVACGDFTRLTLEQLQARAEAFALGEHLQERKTSQSTAISPESILAVREPRQDLGNQCFECGANDHWAKDCPSRVRNLQPRRSVEPKPECKICRKRGHDAQGCWFKGMPRCKRCHGFGHTMQGCRLPMRAVRNDVRPAAEHAEKACWRYRDRRRPSRSSSRAPSRSRSRTRRDSTSPAGSYARKDSSPKRVTFTCAVVSPVGTECHKLRRSSTAAMQKSYQVSARVWGAIEGIRVKMLMDTGAEENLIGKRLASRLESAGVHFDRVQQRRMQGFSSKLGELPIIASADVLLRVGPAAVRDTVLVVEELTEDVIVRFGFQYLARLTVDAIARCIRFADFPDVTLPLLDRSPDTRLLRATATVTIPARCEKFVDVRDVRSANEVCTPVSVVPFYGPGAYARRFTAAHGYAEDRVTRVLVLNASQKPCRISEGAIVARLVGYAEEGDSIGTGTQLGARVSASQAAEDDWGAEMPSLQDTQACRTADEFCRLQAVLCEYRDIFRFSKDPPSSCRGAEATIPTCTAKPCSTPPYKKSPAEKRVVEREVARMLDCGIIGPSTSPWSSGVVLAPKKDGSWRFCVDYTRLNKVTEKDVYPLPRIDDLLAALQGASCFSTLDMATGYWQIPMAQEDKKKTAFTTHVGLYEFNVMPFGLCNAPAAFQRLMDAVLGGVMWTMALVYLDDIVVFSAGFEEHIKRLRMVFDRFRAAGVKLNPKKCRLAQPEVTYLGHVVNATGIKPDPQKVRIVREYPQPTTTRELRRFLGLAGYCRRLKGFSQKAAPLYALVASDAWEWSEDCDRAFRELKDDLASAPLLYHPLPDCPYIIDCDASAVGWGAVLQQQLPSEPSPRIIAYAGRVFTSAERKWSATELEAMAVICSLEEFREYILGRQCVVRSDHGSLRWLQAARKGRLARWALRLQEFDFVLEHRRGSKQAHVDALSRMAGQPRDGGTGELWCRASSTADRIFPDYAFASTAISSHTDIQKPLPLRDQSSARAVQEQRADDECRAVVRAIRTGDEGVAPRWWQLLPQFLRESYITYDGILYKRGESGALRIFVPKSLRDSLVWSYHSAPLAAHLGADRMYSQLRRRYTWPGMRENIRQLIEGCLSCARRKPEDYRQHLIPEAHTSLPKPGLFHTWAIDAYGPLLRTSSGNSYVLVMIDHFSKWPEIVPVANVTAETVAAVIAHRLICQYGCPAAILTDNAKAFDSKLMHELAFRWGIHRLRITPYNPQANGVVEAFMKTLGNSLACLVMEKGGDWDSYCSAVTFAYRTSPHPATGQSPYYVVYGMDPVLPVDRQMRGETDGNTPAVVKRVRYLQKVRSRIFHRLHNRVDHRKAERQPSGLRPGDLALVQLTGQDRDRGSSKLAARYSPPHRVVASHAGGSFYDVLDLQTGVTRRLSHRLLRRFCPSILTPETAPDPRVTELYLPKASWDGTKEASCPDRSNSRPEENRATSGGLKVLKR